MNTTPKLNEAAEGSSSPVPCSPSSTPETDRHTGLKYVACELIATSRRMERERDAAVRIIAQIEERYIDGCNTYEDWKFMGNAARNFLYPERQCEAVPTLTPQRHVQRRNAIEAGESPQTTS